ncbi:MAG TPA: hypothetical protein PLM81_12210 [Ginsengibacter sp.]|nr:hypothetical protein [Ginsengibacter sp.]HRP17739.1 hypothetical protein [Ginsengibacter sp.]HRP45224.1 hypothetical protein [Ginsengibacter sp.]
MMKPVFFLFTIFFFFQTSAQRVITKKSTINSSLNEVIVDYFKNFSNAKGDTLSVMPNFIAFNSKISLPGALSCTIKKYALPDTYSWEAFLFETEDYVLASEQYKKFFQQLNNGRFTPDGTTPHLLKGKMDVPSEQRTFASSHLKFDAPANVSRLKNFMVDLELTYHLPDWQIRLYLYEKLPDDEIRPGTRSIR